jgi:Restriction endonuclease
MVGNAHQTSMPTAATSDLPKPKSWDEFEDIVWEIYTRKWENPHAQRYGRSGQTQHGIDIYGQRNGSGDYIAIQCKRYEDNKLTIKKIRQDVEKTDLFLSQINEYLIVTTDSRDTKIQDYVRKINDEHKSKSKFTIHVIFWWDICSYLAHPDNHDLLTKYYAGWEHIFVRHQNREEEKASSTRHLLRLEIQRDCNLLQELLDQDDQNYLSEKWQLCLRKNRDIWQDISSKLFIIKSGDELMQYIHDFYEQIDSIEEICKIALSLRLKSKSLEAKHEIKNRPSFKTLPPPAVVQEIINNIQAESLCNIKKENFIELKKLKEMIPATLDLGNQIIDILKQ